MSVDLKKVQSVHCFLDIVHAFVKEVPIQDKDWQQYRRDALQAIRIITRMLLPLPQRDPCKGKVIRLVVKGSTLQKKS
jgi:hypothetical protein